MAPGERTTTTSSHLLIRCLLPVALLLLVIIAFSWNSGTVPPSKAILSEMGNEEIASDFKGASWAKDAKHQMQRQLYLATNPWLLLLACLLLLALLFLLCRAILRASFGQEVLVPKKEEITTQIPPSPISGGVSAWIPPYRGHGHRHPGPRTSFPQEGIIVEIPPPCMAFHPGPPRKNPFDLFWRKWKT